MSNTELRDQAVGLLQEAIEVLAGITDTAPPEPPTGIYHGAYIDGTTMARYYGDAYAYTVPEDPDGRVQAQFEQDAGKTISISHWGTGNANVPIWDSNAGEMLRGFEEAWSRGCYPLLDTSTASVYLGDIADGRYDQQIMDWFTTIAGFGKPWIIRLNTEMNGGWYGYGANDTQGPRQIENFKASWVRIWELAGEAGANENATWHWAPNSLPPWDPTYFEGSFADYYPGDEYVDLTGFVCYQQGKEASDGDWSYLSGPSYQACLAVADKPMLVSEWSSFWEFTGPPTNPARGTASSKGEWLQGALEHVRDMQPAIMGMVLFNTGYETGKGEHNEIETSQGAMDGYRAGIGDPIYLGKHTLTDTGKVPVLR
jgi:hypothetical protein